MAFAEVPKPWFPLVKQQFDASKKTNAKHLIKPVDYLWILSPIPGNTSQKHWKTLRLSLFRDPDFRSPETLKKPRENWILEHREFP